MLGPLGGQKKNYITNHVGLFDIHIMYVSTYVHICEAVLMYSTALR